MEVHQIGRATVVTRPGRTSLALALAEAADRPQNWPGLGPRDAGPVRILLVDGASQLAATAPGASVPGWGAGLAFPGARTLVIRMDGGDDPFQTLRHELAHLALHEAVRVRLPLWFNEGYAVVAAGELGRLQALRLNLALAGGRVPAFRELDRELRAGQAVARDAYAFAGTAVAYLARRHPRGTLDALMRRLEGGTGFPDAVLAATGLTLAQFEMAWQRDTKRRHGWLIWLSAGGGWIVAGLLLILAVILRRRRDRPRRAALDQGWVVSDPDGEGVPDLDQTADPR